MKSYCLCLWIIWLLGSACSSDNLAASSTEESNDEKAQVALENEEWDTAIELFEALIAKEAEAYWRYPLLSSSYAGRSGVDVLMIAEGVINAGGGDGNILNVIGQHVPKSPTTQNLSDIRKAIETIEAMPADHRSTDSSYEYGAESLSLLTIYQSAEASMILNQYKQPESSQVSADDLADMTDAEVDAILSNIENMANSGDEDLGPSAAEALAAINSSSGSTSKEKLVDYLSSNN